MTHQCGTPITKGYRRMCPDTSRIEDRAEHLAQHFKYFQIMQSGEMLTIKIHFPTFLRNVKVKAKQRTVLNIGWTHQGKRITFATLSIF